MRILKITLPLWAAVLLCSSCSTTMYVPNAVNAPLFKEKGEVKLSAGSNDLQAAVAVSEHVGILFNGFYKTYRGSGNYEHKGGLAEIAIGYYKPLNDDPFVLEVFAGAGIGKVSKSQGISNGNGPYTASFSADAAKFFFQPEVGYAGRMFDLAFTPRISCIKYNRFHSANYSEADLKADFLENGRITRYLFAFLEPAVTMRIGYKWLKLQAQYGLTINIGGGDIRYPVNFSSLGLVLDLADWYDY